MAFITLRLEVLNTLSSSGGTGPRQAEFFALGPKWSTLRLPADTAFDWTCLRIDAPILVSTACLIWVVFSN
ncbi:hypothetical protein PILCRDRAFT_9838 [Piloderma croceum F 1598]|uniref:Uncharacterized protein n=1 Tax=Piloderma croceum (strain F 1598) TaxID=765440 RepID=A0A0C3FJH0_PILCF|nr:hypothetical protein PILCRDRAFT_9838 [Piloderma croceum F 1598]